MPCSVRIGSSGVNSALLHRARCPLSTSAPGISAHLPLSTVSAKTPLITATEKEGYLQLKPQPVSNMLKALGMTKEIVFFCSFDRCCYCWKYPNHGFQPLRRRPNSWPSSPSIFTSMLLAGLFFGHLGPKAGRTCSRSLISLFSRAPSFH